LNLITNGEIKSVFKYALKDGFTGIKCNQNTIVNIDNTAWIGTSKGLSIYSPEFDKINYCIPKIDITKIQLFLKDVDWAKEYYKTMPWNNLPDNPIFNYSQNHLNFEFTGILLSDKDEIQYKYKLEGFDSEWSPANKKTEATYTSLPPGKYIFKVTASNRYGQWSQTPAEFVFNITPPFWRTIWFYLAVIIFVTTSIILFIKHRERKLKNERDNLEKIVKERTHEVVEQKKEIEQQHDILIEQQKEITESIQHAKRLQSAVIPSESVFNEVFSDSFILYKPKDIVSGDFYWFCKHDNNIIVIAADCTGHGVPGAFTSMLGISLLNKIVTDAETTSPDEIMHKMRENIIKSLNQSEESNLQDGMDMVILTFNTELTELEFCGANNSMFIVRKNEFLTDNPDCLVIKSENFFIKEYKGNKMPVSIYPRMTPFAKEKIKLFPEDKIYIFSDGYMDQIGGPRKKRFMNKQFKEVLLEINNLPMQEQKRNLDQKMQDWMICEKQLDDITVIGIRCR
jgi:serine phosphatase RsbU (regulator of sigma subunit)